MRILPSFLAFATLAACGSAPDPGVGQPEAAAAPAVNAAGAGDQAGLAQWREDVLRGCIGGGREQAGPQVPVEAHCACAVDRQMAGRTLAELEAAERSGAHEAGFTAALRQCIAAISPL